jgi:lipoate-protein ligase A
LIGCGTAWRVIVDGRARGAWNMAVDEALLRSAPLAQGATIRLYGFEPAALSLGRSQPAAGACDARFLEEQGIDLVRRPTGGLAVLHEHERTYAVVGRLDRPPFDGGVVATYRAIGRAIEQALRAIGVAASASAVGRAPDPRGRDGPSCFSTATAHEVVVGGRKLVGSAQLRRREAFLQHGTILVRAEPERLARALGLSACAGFTDLEREVGAVDEAGLDRALLEAIEHVFDATLVPGTLDDDERHDAHRLEQRKYATRAWTIDGTAPR